LICSQALFADRKFPHNLLVPRYHLLARDQTAIQIKWQQELGYPEVAPAAEGIDCAFMGSNDPQAKATIDATRLPPRRRS
jgi:hypothetical protein